MNLKTLLVLGASVVMSISASAWTKPVPQTQDLVQDGETAQYLYNVEAGKFLVGANDWSTRASVGSKGYQWKITDNGNGALTLNDHVEKGNDGNDKGWLAMFCDNNASIWVDNLSGANVGTWTLTAVGEGKYKIGNQAFPDEYLGVGVVGCQGSDTRCYFTSYFTAQDPVLDAYYEWTGVSVEAYDEYLAKEAIYEAADSLGKRIDDIKAQYEGIDLSSAEAVYANEGSSLEELHNAYKSIDQAIVNYSQDHASVASPIDMSAMIVNGTFDTNGNFTGWSGSGFGAGGTTSTCAERYQMTFDTYQDIANIPNGVYKVNVDGFHRSGATEDDYNAEKKGTATPAYIYGVNMAEQKDTTQSTIMHLFHGIQPGAHMDADGNDLVGLQYDATEDGETVSYFVPNSMLDFTNYNGTTKNVTEPFYKTNSVVVPVSEGKIRIGVKCTSSATYSWTIVDNFGLTYYGNGADAWSALMSDYTKNVSLAEGITVTPSVKEAFESAVSSASATDYDSYKAAIASITAAKADVDANVAAWTAYIKAGNQAKSMLDDPQYSEIAVDLSDYMDVYYYPQVGNGEDEGEFSLTTEEIIAETAKLLQLIEDTKSLTPAGTDVTSMLTNPKFAEGWTGWSHSGTGGNVQTNTAANCAEAWNSENFQISQDVTNAPAGMYEISLQGFYRYIGGTQDGWLAYFNEDGTKKSDEELLPILKNTPAKIFLNDNQTSMPNVWEYNVSVDYATSEWGITPIADKTDGGVYTDPNGEYCYPNTMTTAGKMFDMDYYKVFAAGAVANKGDKLTIGVKGSTNDHYGWAIFTNFQLTYQGYRMKYIAPEVAKQVAYLDTLSQPMGSDIKAQVDAIKETLSAIDTEKEYDESEESRDNFNALCEAYALKNKVEASVAIFQELAAENAALEEAMGNTEASEETQGAAGELNAEVAEGIESGEWTDSVATAKIAEIKKMIKMLAIPAEIENASIDNPVDLTTFIENPSFETGSFTGWTQTGLQTQSNTAFGKTGTYYCEKWHVSATLDVHQTIDMELLPAGKYMITVDDYCDEVVAGALYATVGTDSVSTLFSAHESALSPATDTVYIDVPEGKNLTIGACGTLTTSTWFTCDNFKLYYVGAASHSGLKGDVNGDNTVDIADVNAIISVICGGEANPAADVNGDNTVDIADVNAVIGIICGGTGE